MTDTTNATPTLYGRLRNLDGASIGQDGPIVTLTIPVPPLAAIQREIEDAATAPLHAHIEELEAEVEYSEGQRHLLVADVDHALVQQQNLRAENAALREAGQRLRDMAANANDTDEVDYAIEQYDAATTPRAEETPMPDLRHLAEVFVRAARLYGTFVSINMFEECNVENQPKFNEKENAERRAMVKRVEQGITAVLEAAGAPTPTEAQRRDAAPRCPECKGKGCKRCDGYGNHPIAPTPTKAESIPVEFDGVGESDQDPALQARPDRERIDDLITRADGANDRLDMHMRQISDLQKRMDDLERRADKASEQLDLSLQGVNEQKGRLNEHVAHTGRLARRMDSLERIAALEAARTPEPEPVVTDVMVDAFEGAYRDDTLGPYRASRIRAGIAAALRAGGAR